MSAMHHSRAAEDSNPLHTLCSNQEDIPVSLASDQGALLPVPLQKRIRRDRRAHPDRFNLVKRYRLVLPNLPASLIDPVQDPSDPAGQHGPRWNTAIDSPFSRRVWVVLRVDRQKLMSTLAKTAVISIERRTLNTISSWSGLEQITSVKVPPLSIAIRAVPADIVIASDS